MALSTAFPPDRVARGLAVKVAFKALGAGAARVLPQRLGIIGQGNSASTYTTDKRTVLSALEVAEEYGYGSPLHLAALQVLPTNGDGVGTIPVTVYPLEDAGTAVTAAGDITPTGTLTAQATYQILINNIASTEFTLEVGDTVADFITAAIAAINGIVEMPVIAADGTTKLDLTAKWGGASGNDIVIELLGSTTSGMTFAITQPTGGATNPDVQTALDQIGDIWETMFINCMEVTDSATLDKYETWNEGRWLPTVSKFAVFFTGNPSNTVSAAIAVPEARKNDRTNSQLVSPGSNDLPFVTASRQVARIIKLANEDPAHDYGSQQATGLTPGSDSDQWDSVERDAAVKGGSSTIEVRDGVVTISDVVTFYHPTGDPDPAYRFVVDIVKLQNAVYNYKTPFETPEWDGAPLIPDDQPTTNPSAKKPKHYKQALFGVIDDLASAAILADPDFAKANTFVEIDGTNSKRVNASSTVKIAGNTNVFSHDLNWGFNYGTAAPVA